MENKILILTDSSSTISKEMCEQYDIVVLPLSLLRNDGVTYTYEAMNMTTEDFLKMDDEGYSFKTSCTPTGIIEEVVKNQFLKYDKIIALPISQKWSSQYNHLKSLSLMDEYKNKLYVANTMEYGYGLERIAIEIREKINAGESNIDELIKYAENFKNYSVSYYACQSLTGLVNSGRVPKVIAKIMKLAKIKPIIRVEGENKLESIIKNFSEVINKIIKASIKIYGNRLSNKDIRNIAVLSTDNSDEYINDIIIDLSKALNIDKSIIEIRKVPNIFVNIASRGAIGLHIVANKLKSS